MINGFPRLVKFRPAGLPVPDVGPRVSDPFLLVGSDHLASMFLVLARRGFSFLVLRHLAGPHPADRSGFPVELECESDCS